MSEPISPLDEVVNPTGSGEGIALWHRVADFIRNGVGRFEDLAWDVFSYQFRSNPTYRAWCCHLGWNDDMCAARCDWRSIPALPVDAFKWGRVQTNGVSEPGAPLTFRTSGTTGAAQGIHWVSTPHLYRLSAVEGFRSRYGPPGSGGAVLMGLLPGYLERPDSSLVHMVHMLRSSGWKEPDASPEEGFHLHDFEALFGAMERVMDGGQKPVLIGVTWALVDAAEAWRASGRPPLNDRAEVAVTGGMKGNREEWVSARVRRALMDGFGLTRVGGEYGMTELLSQAWSAADGAYQTPPWMRIRLRRADDPLSLETSGSTGGVDVVDLANLGSCAFLSTQDLARPLTGKGGVPSFDLLGRFDRSEVRGCNLMVQ